MQLFYTGVTKFGDPQTDSTKSIGGYISSSTPQNEVDGNLWKAISKYTLWNTQGKEYLALALYNDGSTTITGLKVWVSWNSSEDSEESTLDIQNAAIGIGYQAVQADDCGDLYVEQLPTIYSKPMQVNLVETAIDLSTAIDLPNIEAGMYLGIFLSRRILPAARASFSAEQLAAISAGTLIPATNENFDLVFNWN